MRDRDWKIIKVLYEKRSITKAAESLYITQSALTKRIKAMEEDLGVEIVKSTSKGVMFTEDGQYLFQKATILCDFMDEIREHLSGRKDACALLKIGVPNSFARLHMPQLMREYTNQCDRLQIRTISNSSDVIVQQLIDGSVDVGIICGDYPYLGNKRRLFDEQLYVIAPKNARLDDLDSLPIIETYYNPMVKLIISQWWKMQYGSLPHEQQRVPYSEIAIEMVEKGLGICFLFGADWHVNIDAVQKIPIFDRQERPITRSVWLMWTEQCYREAAMIEWLHFVEGYYGVDETTA